jgi:molecular chaperone DnaK (HSP70)
VTFDIDANGILKVSAKEKTTGKVQSIEIKGSSGLSKEEVERMTKDAEKHAEEDKKKKELVEAKNFGESIQHQAEKSLKEHGDKVPADVKKEVEDKVAELKTALATDDKDKIAAATEAVGMAMQKIGPSMAGPEGAAGAAGGPDAGAAGGAKQAEKVTDVPPQG